MKLGGVIISVLIIFNFLGYIIARRKKAKNLSIKIVIVYDFKNIFHKNILS
jgi:hypothetical protein